MKEYSITLGTPIGKRSGTMTVDIHEGKVCGSLQLLQNTEAFSGVIDGQGNCEIDGTLVTLLRELPYHAVGRITETEIRMEMELAGERASLRGLPLGERL